MPEVRLAVGDPDVDIGNVETVLEGSVRKLGNRLRVTAQLVSVATGYQVEDVMIKAASIKILLARSICSGKFLIAISGDVASVTTAVEAGGVAAGASLIERRQIARVHPSVLQAISMSNPGTPAMPSLDPTMQAVAGNA